MKLYSVVLLLLTIGSPAFAENVDKDGVPNVDIHGKIIITTNEKAIAYSKEWGLPIPRTRMINVNGKQIPLKEFLLTYCQGKFQNETCARGSKIRGIDFSKGPIEQLPKGL
ncbi:MAG: hypothetical protein PHE17_21235 [Thiothrix sp.]|uniref:hypothetical protein n=1 Tax=Thiothrix sp. TaxID=1032 RepID=UPI0026204571|nr:hypothetical protein [Thiothrix sp.]MDD5395555.1 hypothetical protein [Thiothrix sp.]